MSDVCEASVVPKSGSLGRGIRRLAIIAASVTLIFEAGCGGFHSTASLTQTELTAMKAYYETNTGRIDYGSPVACYVYPLGATSKSRELIAYTDVICAVCPKGPGWDWTGEFPAVFHLEGTRVSEVQEANAPGDPMYANEIDRIFPSGLRSRAGGQIPPAALSEALSRASCPA